MIVVAQRHGEPLNDVELGPVESVPKYCRVLRVRYGLCTTLHEPRVRNLALVAIRKLTHLGHVFDLHDLRVTKWRAKYHVLVVGVAVDA